MLLAAVFALLAVGARADQIITGTAITLAAFGLTGTIYRQAVRHRAVPGLTIPTLPRSPSRALADSGARDRRSSTSRHRPTWRYAACRWCGGCCSAPAWAWRYGPPEKSPPWRGQPESRTTLIRAGATVVGGGFAGLAGASLVLAQVGTFAEGMTAGRGYVAIAIVVLGRWHPAGVALGALLFGVATALQYLFQALGVDAPYQLFLMLPYAADATGAGRRGRAGARARPIWDDESGFRGWLCLQRRDAASASRALRWSPHPGLERRDIAEGQAGGVHRRRAPAPRRHRFAETPVVLAKCGARARHGERKDRERPASIASRKAPSLNGSSSAVLERVPSGKDHDRDPAWPAPSGSAPWPPGRWVRSRALPECRPPATSSSP